MGPKQEGETLSGLLGKWYSRLKGYTEKKFGPGRFEESQGI
jgi:hypothetical protein